MGKLKVSYIEEKDLDLIYRLYKHFATFERMEDYHTASPDEIGTCSYSGAIAGITEKN